MSYVSRTLRAAALVSVPPLLLLSACADEEPEEGGAEASVPGLVGTIAFVCEHDAGANDELCIMNADGSDARRITDNASADFAPAWSADGTQLAFNSWRPPHADRPQIYSYDVNSGDVRRITETDIEDQRPSWAPDGSGVVFQRGTFDTGYELFFQPLAGGEPEQLTNNPGKLNVAVAARPMSPSPARATSPSSSSPNVPRHSLRIRHKSPR